jgi:hypothetical protein
MVGPTMCQTSGVVVEGLIRISVCVESLNARIGGDEQTKVISLDAAMDVEGVELHCSGNGGWSFEADGALPAGDLEFLHRDGVGGIRQGARRNQLSGDADLSEAGDDGSCCEYCHESCQSGYT